MGKTLSADTSQSDTGIGDDTSQSDAGTGDDTSQSDAGTGDDTSQSNGDGDGVMDTDAGKRALAAVRNELKAAKADAAAARTEIDDLRREQMDEHEKAVADARDEGRAEAQVTANARLFRAELKAAATGKLLDEALTDLTTDSDVAVRLLGLDGVPVTATGDIDSEAISQAVTEYVAARPFLAAGATPPPGDIDQGRRGGPPPQSLDDRIVEAERAGNWKLSGQLKASKLAAAVLAPEG